MELIKEDDSLEPVSPSGQYLNSKVMSVSILGILELEIPIDDSQAMSLFRDNFLPINPRFSSIMVTGEKGARKWKKVGVNMENHVHVPSFSSPKGSSSPSENDSFLKSYISQIAMQPFPQGQPLWEIHIIKCPTSEAQETLIFKLHHALGDGYSLVAALLSCLQRADDPSLPVTSPSVKKFSSANKDDRNIGLRKVVSRCFSPLVNTTVNDVISGVIFLGTRLYMQRVSTNSNLSTNSTALVLLNTRNLRDYKPVRDMVRPNSESPWGNHFAFLHVPIPKVKPSDSQFSNPLKFVYKTHEVIKRKRSSFGVILTGKLLEIMQKCRNAEAVAKHISRTARNSSMGISNVIGPINKLSLANDPLRGVYFTVADIPWSLLITILSYAGNLRVAVGAEQGFIDSELYNHSLLDAFDMILRDACQKQ
ncbi:hypothetical protein ACJRO7_006479 [Eucalyptus globulus]|uniref:Diacylglycerol O-acyltransferase n=1 Tax=Eucalyptus globulus TaxID=34317 RepID=A0ABD3IHX4_EUCGL